MSVRSHRLKTAFATAAVVAFGFVIQLAPSRGTGAHEIDARGASATDCALPALTIRDRGSNIR